jgi:hypothetical protein
MFVQPNYFVFKLNQWSPMINVHYPCVVTNVLKRDRESVSGYPDPGRDLNFHYGRDQDGIEV